MAEEQGRRDSLPQALAIQEEVTWQSVQQIFDKTQDRSWQLPAEDLTICLRPDGTDWVLGSGGFGTVRTWQHDHAQLKLQARSGLLLQIGLLQQNPQHHHSARLWKRVVVEGR